MKKLFALLVVAVVFMTSHAYNRSVVDSLERELATASSLKDSLAIAIDLFDASAREKQFMRADFALNLARRANDEEAQLDMLRNLANLSISDSLFNVCLDCVSKLSSSPEQQLTRLYIKIRQNSEAARTSTIEHSRERVKELMNRVEVSNGRSTTTRLEVLFTLCAYLEQVSTGELLTDHLQTVGQLIDALPEKLDALESLYLTQSSLTYTAMCSRVKAVEADKRLLELLDKIEANYRAKGRKFKDFSYGRYVIYRRLLGNYEALTPEEAEMYHSAAAQMAANDPTAKEDFENVRRPDMYYYLARKEYGKALPLLKYEAHQQERPLLLYVRRLLVNGLIDAAQAVNDRDALLDALLLSRELDDNDMTRHSAEQFRELQFIYDRNNEKMRNLMIEQDRLHSQVATHRVVYVIGAVFLVILFVLLFVLVRTWRKAKALNRNLERVNGKLIDERDTLQRIQADLIRTGERAKVADSQREQFINNMSHEVSTPLNAIVEYSQLIVDCIDEDKKPYLTRFARVVKLNAELVQTLVNDVLDLASIDKKTLKVEKHPIVACSLAEVALDSVKSRLQPGVELVNKIQPDYNLIINTDPRRVTQVLYNLLVNAAKFTTEGTITLDGHTVGDGNFYEFSVTDTGIGIPKGKEEVIFNRFEKLNRYSQGIGLGLSVSRMLASLLGGELKVDTDHKGGGARFIFTIPVK